MKKTTTLTRDKQIVILKGVILDIFWMARRYADGRFTYAPHMYNDAIKRAQSVGMEFPENTVEKTVWAEDGDKAIRSH